MSSKSISFFTALTTLMFINFASCAYQSLNPECRINTQRTSCSPFSDQPHTISPDQSTPSLCQPPFDISPLPSCQTPEFPDHNTDIHRMQKFISMSKPPSQQSTFYQLLTQAFVN